MIISFGFEAGGEKKSLPQVLFISERENSIEETFYLTSLSHIFEVYRVNETGQIPMCAKTMRWWRDIVTT